MKRVRVKYFEPSDLGLALVEAYANMSDDAKKLSQPHLRAAMEQNCVRVSKGEMTKQEAIDMCLAEMKPLFEDVVRNASSLDNAVARRFSRLGETANASTVVRHNFSKCGVCSKKMALKKSKGADGANFLHSATCSKAHSLPTKLSDDAVISPTGHMCPECRYAIMASFFLSLSLSLSLSLFSLLKDALIHGTRTYCM